MFLILTSFSPLKAQEYLLKSGSVIYSDHKFKAVLVKTDTEQEVTITQGNSPYRDKSGRVEIRLKIKTETGITGYIHSDNLLLKNSSPLPSAFRKIYLPLYYIEAINSGSPDIIIQKDYEDPEWNVTKEQILTYMKKNFRPWFLYINETTLSLIGPEFSSLFYIKKIYRNKNGLILDLSMDIQREQTITVSIAQQEERTELILKEYSLSETDYFHRKDLLNTTWTLMNEKILKELNDLIHSK